jgi:hypothetical protein
MTRFRYTLFAAIALLLSNASLATAQSLEFRYERDSATEEEAAVRAQGDFLRDQGRAAESWSEAYRRYQDGDRMRIENERQFEENTRQQRMAVRLAWRERRVRATQPRRVSSKVLTAEGVIVWPDLLLRPEFAEGRQRMEQLFHERAKSELWELPKLTADIQATSGELRSQLDALVLDISPVSHLRSAKFLRNLAYESTFPAAKSTAAADRLAID